MFTVHTAEVICLLLFMYFVNFWFIFTRECGPGLVLKLV